MSTKAILLVGHGSSFSRESSAPVYQHAAWIRDQKLYDDLHVAFWKEPPWIRDSLALIRTDEIHVVPRFMADGYFVREIVPRELGNGRPVRLCPPVGAHACMPDLVLKRADTANADRKRSTLVVVGHGTERSSTSSAIVRQITLELRERSGYGQVACGFLDQDPHIEDVVEQQDSEHIVLVPFFMADGWHVRESIPRSMIGSRQSISYTRAVGTLTEVAWAAVDLARAGE